MKLLTFSKILLELMIMDIGFDSSIILPKKKQYATAEY